MPAIMAGMLIMVACDNESHDISEDRELKENWQVFSSDGISVDGGIISSNTFSPDNWYSATVPNTVLAVLVDNNEYQDIFLEDNFDKISREQFEIPWWYRTVFTLEAKERKANYRIIFEGLNYKANIWLNGKLVAGQNEVEGCFRIFEFDVTEHIKNGENVLAVEVIPPVKGDLTIGFVDWNPWPPDNSMGIWRPVKLSKSGQVSLKHLFVKPKLDIESLKKASITVSTELTNYSGSDVECTVSGRMEDIEFSKSVHLKGGESRIVIFSPENFPQLNLENPRIWWPNNLGSPELYQIDMTVTVGKNVTDHSTTSFGIRDVQDYINDNGHRGYKVNGKKVQIMGAGWVDDVLLADPDEKVRAQLDYVKAMNLNTIRLEGFWGRNQKLYDMADENGILVMVGWSCQWEWEGYCGRQEEEFMMIDPGEYTEHARAYIDQVKWLRNHPSVFLWVYGSDKLLHPELEKMLNESINKEDGTRPILGSCKYQESEVTGPTAVKMLGPYHYVTPNYWYTDTENGGAYGFNTETGPGLQPPVLESIKKMIPEKDLWPMNEIWDYHTGRNEFASFELWINPFKGRYGESADVEEFAFKAQMSNYEAVRAMFEAFVVNKHNATGVIQWMLNSAFPNMLWQLYDWYLMPTGAYYGTKTALQPVNIIYNYGDRNIYVANAYNHAVEDLEAEIKVFDINSKLIFSSNLSVNIGENTSKMIQKMPRLQGLTTTYFMDLRLKDREGKALANNFYWLSNKEDILDWKNTQWHVTPNKSYADMTGIYQLPKARVEVSFSSHVAESRIEVPVKLNNLSDKIAFFTELTLKDDEGAAILPVFWEDNYISLLPGEIREIMGYVYRTDYKGETISLGVEFWNME